MFVVPIYNRPVQERSWERFNKIIATAQQHVGTVGYDELSLAFIAEQSGVSVHSIYRYFPDITAIFGRFLEEFFSEWEKAVTDFLILSRNKNTWERDLSRFIKSMAEHVVDRPFIPKTQLFCRLDPKLEKHWWQMVKAFEGLFVIWLKSLGYKADGVPVAEMANFIVIQIDAMLLDIGRHSNTNKMQSMQQFRRVIISYLSPHIPTA
jgi:AcrR family transcriptional regulator